VSRNGLKALIRRVMPKTVRAHRILGGRLRGYRIVTSWHDYPGAILGRTERALLEWFERHVRPGETWLDVGAHYGYTAIALSRLVGAAGRVFAFEPVVATAGYSSRTGAANGLRQLIVIPCALGAPETLELKRLPPARGMVDSTIEPGGGALETFLVTRLDWLWSRICGERRRVDGVKIDVQGMEIDVIAGMENLLREFAPKLVVEMHRGVERGRLLDALDALGYGRRAEPIEPAGEETEPQYLDDRSYYFRAASRPA
jgi:FkbM family methyltransferase